MKTAETAVSYTLIILYLGLKPMDYHSASQTCLYRGPIIYLSQFHGPLFFSRAVSSLVNICCYYYFIMSVYIIGLYKYNTCKLSIVYYIIKLFILMRTVRLLRFDELI